MYKVAIIGCGSRAPAHIEAYNFVENAKVTACCGLSEERRGKISKKYAIPAYGDAKQMLNEERPDIVHLVTNPDTRVELMNLVSECKIPMCIVEKPISSGVSDWKKLSELESITETKFAVCHQFRWQKDLARSQQAVKSGLLGDLKLIDISSGMNITGQGTHTLNYGMSLNGNIPVEKVFGNVSGWDNEDRVHPGPLTTEAFITFKNGVRALWTSGPVSLKCGDPKTNWQHVRVAAYGEKGRTLYEEFGKWETVSSDFSESGDFGGFDEWQHKNVLAQAELHKAVIDWLETGREPGTSLKQSLHEWKVVLAVYQSALKNEVINIDEFEPDPELFEKLKAKLG